MTHPTTLIHTSINRPAEAVYAYTSQPQHFSEWAAGLSNSELVREGDFWVANSPMGKVKIKFAPKNTFGVIDHDVTTPDGHTVHNPLRVQPNGDGADVIFTLHQLPGISAADFERDANLVRTDLAKLKSILEQMS